MQAFPKYPFPIERRAINNIKRPSLSNTTGNVLLVGAALQNRNSGINNARDVAKIRRNSCLRKFDFPGTLKIFASILPNESPTLDIMKLVTGVKYSLSHLLDPEVFVCCVFGSTSTINEGNTQRVKKDVKNMDMQ